MVDRERNKICAPYALNLDLIEADHLGIIPN